MMSNIFVKDVGGRKSRKDIGKRNYRMDFFKKRSNSDIFNPKIHIFFLFISKLRGKVFERTSVGENLRRTSVGRNLKRRKKTLFKSAENFRDGKV